MGPKRMLEIFWWKPFISPFCFFEGNLLCHLLNPCNVTFPSKLLPNRLKCYWPDLPFVTSGENLEMFPAKTVLE